MMTHIAVIDFEIDGIAGREVITVATEGKEWANMFLLGTEFGLSMAAAMVATKTYAELTSLRLKGMTCYAMETTDAQK